MLVPIVSVVAVVIAVGAVLWARAAQRRARRDAEQTGTAGAPPLAAAPGDATRGMWAPQDPELHGWTWSAGRTQPPDLLSGPHAVYETVVAREICGDFRARDAFAQVRSLQRLPVVPRSAPHTHWSKVAGLRSRVALPPFFLLTEQVPLVAATRVLEVADGLAKVAGPHGTRTVLWADPRWVDALLAALRPLIAQRTEREYFVASDGDLLFVCESAGEDEEAVLRRLRYGDDLLRALEALIAPGHGGSVSS
ncbi:hypothetical protein GCM10022202_20130 [Microbacterium marinilacus]|uniref:Uncharacterized protein n=1 Tax=Microbacterium marinilacus TaxID=415209 RepID=A0ABP7BHK2_9MICO